ncbi:MAG: Tfp pilus assembly protein FimT/FimU [Pseudoramibacter sp.]
MWNSQTSNRGMTLAEMLVVLALVAMLSSGAAVVGTAGVRMANRQAFDAECAALRDTLNDARDRALMQSARRDAVVDLYSDMAVVKVWDDRKDKYQTQKIVFEKLTASAAKGAADPNYHYQVRFSAQGTINKGQTIRLNGPAQLKSSLVLQPVTGRIWLSP